MECLALVAFLSKFANEKCSLHLFQSIASVYAAAIAKNSYSSVLKYHRFVQTCAHIHNNEEIFVRIETPFLLNEEKLPKIELIVNAP